jgi:hypothetical protein
LVKPSPLGEFIATLVEDVLYAFDRKVVWLLVNGRRLRPSARLKPGDRVVVFPVIVSP